MTDLALDGVGSDPGEPIPRRRIPNTRANKRILKAKRGGGGEGGGFPFAGSVDGSETDVRSGGDGVRCGTTSAIRSSTFRTARQILKRKKSKPASKKTKRKCPHLDELTPKVN